jgi:hypothetical protein
MGRIGEGRGGEGGEGRGGEEGWGYSPQKCLSARMSVPSLSQLGCCLNRISIHSVAAPIRPVSSVVTRGEIDRQMSELTES